MLNLSVLTTAEHRKDTGTGHEDDLPHGFTVLKKLVAPWAGTKRAVCADSYFASVTAAEQLLGMGLRFIRVVKATTRGYTRSTVSVLPLEARGQHISYTRKTADGVADMLAVLWVDREQRYFISTASCTLPGRPCDRVRWRQVGSHAERPVLTVPQPLVVETYYKCCAQIDRNNRCRQYEFLLERQLVTHNWSMRVNLSLLGMCVVNAWLLYAGARGPAAALTQKQFYEDLAAQLIDNTYESVGLRPRGVAGAVAGSDGAPVVCFGIGVQHTPTLMRRKGDSDHRAQRDCRVFKSGRTTLVC